MKKFKLMATSLFLALALTFASATCVKVYADDGDPQGGSKTGSAPAPPPPPPPPSVIEIILIVLRMI